ncbi:metabotropic glutamate receptor 3-like, partial [Amphibalanus amphitrite]|uniref:metabotropic glutamate receptor 3-like n=1 Tax=Amphibalanus amphitrite TaxID=1232801 RepID=UPI001C91B612
GSGSYSVCETNVTRPKPVSGVIGAAFSGVSINVAKILQIFKIPQISYASTSTELSDKTRFEYFSRVVPPDNRQAQAMVQVVRALGWKYVSTVAVQGDYGEKGISSFTSQASSAGICVAVAEKILRNANETDFDNTIAHLAAKPEARGVIMFVDEDNIRKLLAAAVRANITDRFLWVGSDSWGAKVHPVRNQEHVAEGAITILPQRTPLPGFDKYFRSLRPPVREDDCVGGRPRRPHINCRDIWFHEFWSQAFNCTFDRRERGERRCTGNETLTKYKQEGLVPFVVDAVYALAHALHNMLVARCGGVTLCKEVQPVPDGQQLLKHIRNVSFIGRQKRKVRFNEYGDAIGFYNIYQFQKRDGKYEYYQIGEWVESLSYLSTSKMKWRGDSSETPSSICSQPCPLGKIRNFQDACCWSCVKCPEGDRIDNDTCVECPLGHLPTADYRSCYRLTAEYMAWSSGWALVPAAISSVGIVVTLLVIAVFLRFNNTPVIKASGRELCYVLLCGIVVCYAMTFVILMKPSVVSCTMMRIGLGLCLNICYSALLTKTNRISRIFNMGMRSIKRPPYTSPRSQIAICFGLVSIQLIGIVVWLILERPSTKEVYPNRRTAVLTCGISSLSQVVSLGYNMVLIILCTWYAFKTRKIPENFNEAKYIGFTMYSTCIVWLAFVPIYFTTYNEYKVQLASLCICVTISATVALLCLFTPKLYIVIFQPYKNVRQAGGGNQNSAGRPNNMRFARTRQIPTASSQLTQLNSAPASSMSLNVKALSTASEGEPAANGNTPLLSPAGAGGSCAPLLVSAVS